MGIFARKPNPQDSQTIHIVYTENIVHQKPASCASSCAGLIIAVVAAYGLVMMFQGKREVPRMQPPPAPPVAVLPSPPVAHVEIETVNPFRAGDTAILIGPNRPDDGRNGVFVAVNRADVEDLIEAERRIASREGAHPGEMSADLATAKRTALLKRDARVRVLRVDGDAIQIRVAAINPTKGVDTGWVPSTWIRSAK